MEKDRQRGLCALIRCLKRILGAAHEKACADIAASVIVDPPGWGPGGASLAPGRGPQGGADPTITNMGPPVVRPSGL